MKLTDTDKAYFAGLLDGEGCVGYYARTSKNVMYHSASLHICMTDPRPAQWIMGTLRCGRVSFSLKPGNRKPVYSWQLCNQPEIRQLLMIIRPFLLVKGEQVDVILHLWELEDSDPKRKLTPAIIKRRQYVADEVKRLKMVGGEGVETRREGSAIH